MIIPLKNCRRCGKEFVVAPRHVYKIGDNYYCRYNCYIADFKEMEDLEMASRVKYAFDKYGDPVRRYRRGVKLYDPDGNLVKSYTTMQEAADDLGYGVSTISMCCSGKREYPVKGYVLKYGED